MLPWVMEYSRLNRLAKLGFTMPLDRLDAHSADMLLAVQSAYADLEQEELKRKR